MKMMREEIMKFMKNITLGGRHVIFAVIMIIIVRLSLRHWKQALEQAQQQNQKKQPPQQNERLIIILIII
jgi:hypothetical protein